MNSSRRAMTIAEVLVSIGLFSMLMLLAATFANQGQQLWRSVSGAGDANLQIKKAARLLNQDLTESNFINMATTTVPASLAPAKDGSAIWMLSCVNPTTGAPVLKSDGSPFWQRNVLYYIVIPQGVSMVGEADSRGFEVRCPNKVLIRKVIDSGNPTTPASDPVVDSEKLMSASEINNYLTRPVGKNISAMSSEPNVQDVQLLAHDLLSFEADLRPDEDFLTEVQIVLRAVNFESARKDGGIGNASLRDSIHTLTLLLSVYPRN